MVLATRLKDAKKEGFEAGQAQGREEERRDIALEMLEDGENLTKIIKYSKLSDEEVLSLAKENGLEVVR